MFCRRLLELCEEWVFFFNSIHTTTSSLKKVLLVINEERLLKALKCILFIISSHITTDRHNFIFKNNFHGYVNNSIFPELLHTKGKKANRLFFLLNLSDEILYAFKMWRTPTDQLWLIYLFTYYLKCINV